MFRWSKRPWAVSGSSVWVKGGALLGQSVGSFVGVTVFVFELEEVVASCLRDGVCLWFVVIKRVAGDGRSFQIGFCVALKGYGLLAFAFVLISL